MGFNPFGKQRKSALDIAVVAVFIIITAAAVLWGFFG
jgi:diacylglycerol kinase